MAIKTLPSGIFNAKVTSAGALEAAERVVCTARWTR